MHLGNVMAALLSWLSVKSKGGIWVLRHEDLDPERSRLPYAQQIEDDLLWLGLTWDEGGLECRGDYGPYVQSQRADIYARYLAQLEPLLYPCFCTRADRLAASAPHADDLPASACRCFALTDEQRHEMALLRKPSTKMHWPEPFDNAFTDGHYGDYRDATKTQDLILRRSDGTHAYQLAVVVDDALMGITEVVRGCDLLPSTPVQQQLYRLLGLQAPTFYHHPLLCASDGRRLCKRDLAQHLGELRKRMSAQEVIGELAYRVNLIPEPTPMTPQELIPLFAWEKVPTTNIIIR